MVEREKVLNVNRCLENFDEILIEIECEHDEVLERFEKAKFHLEKVKGHAEKLEAQKEEISAVELYFLCLAMVKKVIDSPLFYSGNNTRQQKQLQQSLLKTYDLPCSLKLCNIMYEVGNHEEVVQLAERVLIIDPNNGEAAKYIKDIDELDKQSQFTTLDSSNGDLRSFLEEYIKESEEKSPKESSRSSKSNGQTHNHKNNEDPGQVLLLSCEVLIKLILLIPLMVFEWLVEPTMLSIFSRMFIPLYQNVLLKVPIVAPVAYRMVVLSDWVLDRVHRVCRRISGQSRIERRSYFQ